jgi:hypothetical protein
MSTITEFDGTGDVIAWALKVKAKLLAKGYKAYLEDKNKPAEAKELLVWNTMADKATGLILTYMNPSITVQFDDKVTPQSLIEAVVKLYCPDINQEIERLERELTQLTYNEIDPVVWAANVRGLVAKLVARQAAPNERTVRHLVLNALESVPEYKIRVEMIRYDKPNISLNDLWAEVGKLPYPLNRESMLLTTHKKPHANNRAERDNKHKQNRRRCYVCGSKDHLAHVCPKRAKSDDSSDDSSNDESSSKKKKEKAKLKDESLANEEKEKRKEKKKDKAMSNTYSFFAQTVLDDELETEHVGSGINW